MAVECRFLPLDHCFLAPAFGCGLTASGENSTIPEVDGLEGDSESSGDGISAEDSCKGGLAGEDDCGGGGSAA